MDIVLFYILLSGLKLTLTLSSAYPDKLSLLSGMISIRVLAQQLNRIGSSMLPCGTEKVILTILEVN